VNYAPWAQAGREVKTIGIGVDGTCALFCGFNNRGPNGDSELFGCGRRYSLFPANGDNCPPHDTGALIRFASFRLTSSACADSRGLSCARRESDAVTSIAYLRDMNRDGFERFATGLKSLSL
jgi:hypothetical protein